MDFLTNQIHKLLISNKLNFDLNSEFEESDYEQWWKIYPYGTTISKNENASVDVIFTGSNAIQNKDNFIDWIKADDFQKTLSNPEYGISTQIIYKGLTNITEYKNAITCTLDLYVSNPYTDGTYNANTLTNEQTTIKINSLNIGNFGCISLKGNYKELTDIHKSKMSSIAKDVNGVNYPVLKKSKKEASLKFVIRSQSIQETISQFKNFIYFCQIKLLYRYNVLLLEHQAPSDNLPNFETYGIFTQFTPTYLNFQQGKAWLEFTATFRMVDILTLDNPF